MINQTDKQLFAELAASAPRLDLQFYVTYAQQHRDSYTDTTRAIVGEMVALLDELTERPSGSTAIQKRTVWTLIDHFKSSIQGWYGAAGRPDYEAAAMQAQVALWVTRGRSSELLDPKTPVIEARACSTPVAAPVTPKAPTWRARAIAAETKARELEARLQRYQERAQPSPDSRVNAINAASRRPRVVAPVAPVIDGEKTCQRCAQTQPIYQFAWAAHGAIRNICRQCRKAQAAARKQPRAA